eukprot:3902916-Rhodomonas_salina.3
MSMRGWAARRGAGAGAKHHRLGLFRGACADVHEPASSDSGVQDRGHALRARRRLLPSRPSHVRRREEYDSFLRQVPLLQALDAEERGKIADVLVSASFEDGEYIIRQGETGN